MTRALLLLVALAGCATAPGPGTPRTVVAVDLARYAGTWYELARYPNRFEDGPGLRCLDVTATYAPRPDGRLGVENRCRNAEVNSETRVARGTAYAVPGSNNARLRVSFFWPFHGDYWVLALAPAYRWALVGDPNRAYLWLLSRTPALPAADHAQAVEVARREGFDPARLQSTPQSAAAQ